METTTKMKHKFVCGWGCFDCFLVGWHYQLKQTQQIQTEFVLLLRDFLLLLTTQTKKTTNIKQNFCLFLLGNFKFSSWFSWLALPTKK